MASVQVRQAEISDIAQLVNLQFEVYPPPDFPPINRWGASHLEAHQEIFPQGQLVAVIDGRIVGSSTSMITTRERAEKPHTFAEITGGARLLAHDPEGDVLYGVDLLVSPYFRGLGVAKKLYEARFLLQQRLGLDTLFAGARIPGYAPYASRMSAEEYVEKVVAGELRDPTLSMQLHLGFRVKGILPRYMPDPQTRNYAALICRELSARAKLDTFDRAPSLAVLADKAPRSTTDRVL